MINLAKIVLRVIIKFCFKILPDNYFIIVNNQIKYVKLKTIYSKKNIEKFVFPVINNESFIKEEKLIESLIYCFNISKIKQQNVENYYLPGPAWSKQFNYKWNDYNNALSKTDVHTLSDLLRNFFRNEGISGLWGGDNMFSNFCSQGKFEELIHQDLMMQHYKIWKDLCPSVSLSTLNAPSIGNPYGYKIDGVILYEPVFEYHYQATYFNQLLSEIKNPVILEIGGGFGGLAYFLLKNSSSVKYIGFDLPENILIQSYYLSKAFPNSRILKYDDSFTKLNRDVLELFDIVLLPNFELDKVESLFADLIVNVRSLSEMSYESIVNYLNEIDRIGRMFFFHENISKPRSDEEYGVPSNLFPKMKNFIPISNSESKWSKYKKGSSYPCDENLLMHSNLFKCN